MKKSVQFYSKNFRKLILDINLIGYEEQGESIVVLLKEDSSKDVIFSCIVDCYETKQNNIPIEILEENNVQAVDVFCWTHPHEDHSKGINKLLPFFDKKTRIIIPSNLKMDNASEEIKELYNQIIVINRNGNQKDGKLILTSDTKTLFNTTYKDNHNDSIDVEMTAYTPISSRVINQLNNKEIDYNEYSIMLVLQVGEIKILLTGDVQKGTIESFKIENANISDVNYIKAPHHCSKTSDNLLDIVEYDEESTVFATTVFKRYNLPNNELLDKYKRKFNCVLCTSKSYKDETSQDGGYGVATMSINLNTNKYVVKTKGEAIRLID